MVTREAVRERVVAAGIGGEGQGITDLRNKVFVGIGLLVGGVTFLYGQLSTSP